MSAVAATFFLIAVIKADAGFSFTDLASFKTDADCQQALGAITDRIAVAGEKNADFYCIPADALEKLNNR